MAPGSLVDKIRALLASDAHERQIAAAIVLGEIGARDAAVIDALARAAAGGVPPVQRHALEALARLAGGKTARPRRCRGSWPAARRATIRSGGRRSTRRSRSATRRWRPCASGWRRRPTRRSGAPWKRCSGRVGGKDAFSALLAALDTPDIDAARAAALAVRQRVKEATARARRRATRRR